MSEGRSVGFSLRLGQDFAMTLTWQRPGMEDNMIRRMSGIALIILGDMALIIALAADDLGLGTPGSTTGYKQISLAVAAIVIQLIGIVMSQVETRTKGISG